jgi:small subunit ribosomal protein S30e
MGKVHGSLARAGKVKGQTPKVEKQDRKQKKPKGRAHKRLLYIKRFVNVVVGANGVRVKGYNTLAAQLAVKGASPTI